MDFEVALGLVDAELLVSARACGTDEAYREPVMAMVRLI
ncbi:MAG: hypothetical protein AVDCRST_MAG28-399 [uncultured Rubrobacteraceae bacterium]|uniref:Uncharacterized protein n=1 Tax=uncultured Rubrobacteraceae bacterium TaxID=349277 RepID=A0A6J4QB30_9ACTN|nr:MAG: hypothetical protein AVDCRST_MAG28-399 [uncultured Rubrobacteraceae bacterium]